MKEQTLLQIKNKVETLTDSNLYLLREIAHIRELAVGTFETIKLMPGYEEALEKLKENMIKQKGEKPKNHEKEQLPT